MFCCQGNFLFRWSVCLMVCLLVEYSENHERISMFAEEVMFSLPLSVCLMVCPFCRIFGKS